MATQLFLREEATPTPYQFSTGNNDAPIGTASWGATSGWSDRWLSTARGSGVVSSTRATISGNTTGIEFPDATTLIFPAAWVSAPLDADVTISGTITFNLWMGENASTNNMGAMCVVERIKSDGSIDATPIASSEKGTECPKTSSIAAQNWTVTATSTNMLKGDRLRIRVLEKNVGTMGTDSVGGTFTYSGTSAAATGDSYVSFTETFSFMTTDPTTTTIYLTETAAGITPDAAFTELEAWTSRGAAATTHFVSAVTGWTAPVQLVHEWFTKPLTAVTLAGPVLVNARARETNAIMNAAVGAEIAITATDGTGAVVWGNSVHPTEMTTAEAAYQFYVAGADVAITDGQRLRIRLVFDDSSILAMTQGTNTLVLYDAGTSAGASGDTYLVFGQSLTEFTSGTQTPQTVAATTTLTAALVKRTGKPLASTLTVAPTVVRSTLKPLALTLVAGAALAKRITKPLAATVTATAALVKQVGKPIAASVSLTAAMVRAKVKAVAITAATTLSAALSRSVGKPLSVTLTATAAMTRRTAKTLASSLTATTAMVRQTNKALALAVSVAAGLVTAKLKAVLLAVTATLSAAVSKRVGKPVAAATTLTAAVAKRVGKPLTVGLSMTVGLIKTTAKTLAVGLTAGVDLVAQWLHGGQTFPQAIAATTTLAANLTKQVGKPIAAVASFTLAMVRRVGKPLAVTSAIGATVSKQVGKLITLGSTITAAMSRVKTKVQALAATVTLTPALVKRVGKPLAATVSMTAALLRRIPQTIAVALSMGAALTRRITKSIAATVTLTAAMTRSRIKAQLIAATTTLTAGLTRLPNKALAVTVAFTASLVRSTAKVLQVTLTVGVGLAKTIAVTVAASLVAGVNLVVERIAAGFRTGLGAVYHLIVHRGRTKPQEITLAGVYKPTIELRGVARRDT